MHTIFEGVLNLETRLLLLSFVNDHKYFTLEFLNERIANRKTEQASSILY